MDSERTDGRTADPSGFEQVDGELRVERQRTGDERDAFDAFRGRIRGIPVEGRSGGPRRTAVVIEPASRGLSAVREAYEATVMSVPHFLEEYDESYAEHLAEEFGPDVAAALTDGDAFDETCKRRLLAESEAARDLREEHLETLASERESVEETRTRVASVLERLQNVPVDGLAAERFESLDANRALLLRLEAKVDDLAAQRQAVLQRQGRQLRIPGSAPDLQQYLYQDIEATYPVLSVIGQVGHLLAVRKRAVESAMGTCH